MFKAVLRGVRAKTKIINNNNNRSRRVCHEVYR